VGCLNIARGLCQVSPQYLQVGVPHQLLKAVNVGSISQALQSKSAAEIMQTWNRNICPFRLSPDDLS
jgi:hypothetical protein